MHAPLFVSESTSLRVCSDESDLVRVNGIRRAMDGGAGSTVRRDCCVFDKRLLEREPSSAEDEWVGVGGECRAAFGVVDESMVSRIRAGECLTILETMFACRDRRCKRET